MSVVPQLGGQDIEGRVRAAFAGHRDIAPDTNFFEAGISSTTLAEILDGLRTVGFDLALVDLYRWPTVRALVTEIRRRAEGSTAPVRRKQDPPWLRGPS
ncbi:MAG: Phosphopantetheine attachment site [Micromonosporaceae bacterium]